MLAEILVGVLIIVVLFQMIIISSISERCQGIKTRTKEDNC